MTHISLILILSIFLSLSPTYAASACAGQTQDSKTQKEKSKEPQQSGGDDHDMGGMNKRGDRVMGFDQMKTTHHFRLTQDGGSIEVSADDAKDEESRKQIRMHLSHIARMFSEGNFNAPMLIHDQTPPGVPVMQRLKAEITYKFEEIERGGRVRISSNNREAVAAIHEFLRFQIKEHKTGDPLTVTAS
jgi:hypothetical protein